MHLFVTPYHFHCKLLYSPTMLLCFCLGKGYGIRVALAGLAPC